MAETPPTEDQVLDVDVGDETFSVGRFRGFKAQEIMRRSAAIARRYPKIAKEVGEFERAYIEANALQLSRTEAELKVGPAAAEITEPAWQTTGGVLPLKRMPGIQDRAIVLYGELVEVAHGPLGELLALISLTNQELEEADNADNVVGVVSDRRRHLLHRGEPQELIALAMAGYQISRGQFGPLEGLITKGLELLGLTMGEPAPMESPTSPATTPTPSSPSSDLSEESSERSSSGATSPSSSPESPAPTDGPAERSSTEPPGRPSEPALSG